MVKHDPLLMQCFPLFDVLLLQLLVNVLASTLVAGNYIRAGRYLIHFHLVGETRNAFIKNNAIYK